MSYTAESILKLERESIAAFVLSCREHLKGRVLDYGCGQQPYRQIVLDHIDEDGEYVPHDRADYPANVSGRDVGPDDPLGWDAAPDAPRGTWDAILANQIIQYHAAPDQLLSDFLDALRPGGVLILTGPTNWREIEPEDHSRFTRAGIRYLLEVIGFEVLRLESRAQLDVAPGFSLSLGYGALARA